MDPDDASAVRGALVRLRRSTGLTVAFGGVVTQTNCFRLTELTGTSTTALHGLAISSGRGLGGRVLALGEPMAVDDYRRAPTISHQYDKAVHAEGLRAILAVPVVVRRTVRAVLYGALRQSVLLGDRTLTAALDAARDLGQDLAAREAVEQRLMDLEVARSTTPSRHELREVYAEIRALAQEIDDPVLRARLQILSTRLTGTAASDPTSPPHPIRPGARLSTRELDVLACVALGQTNAEIARHLGLLPETVKSYLRTATRKLGSHTRLETVVAARRTGQLP